MQTTRRDAMKHGGKVIATAAVLPFLSTINPAQAQEDAGLFALYDEYRRLEKQYEAAETKATDASVAVRDAFRDSPSLKTVWQGINIPGSPERVALIDAPGTFNEAMETVEREAKEIWNADLAEAEERAGASALKKKQDTACNAWLDAMHRFMAMRAHTPAGMILKFHIAWCDKQRQHWEANHFHGGVEFWDDAMASVLMDLERLAGHGRAI